ncbi:MAG: phosphotransferase, partial [Ilumatobacteraceae bacterium]
PDDPTHQVVCHGDLHPRNVLLGPDGPVVVDWFDASRGSFTAEVARTSLMLELSHGLGGPPVSAGAIDQLRASYLRAATEFQDVDASALAKWRTVHLVARLGEGLGGDVAEVRRLLDLR